MRSVRTVLAAVAVAAAVLPLAPAAARWCPPGFHEQRFSGPGGGTWTMCVPD